MAKEPFFKVMLSRIWSSKRLRMAIFAIVFFVLAFLGIRGCVRNNEEHKYVYKIARTTIYPSIDVAGKEANLQAFLDDLILQIAREEKIRFTLVTLNYGNLFHSLDDESYDAILTTVSLNRIIPERYFISEPIYVGGPVLVVPTDSAVTEAQELRSLNIGINKNSPHIFQINQRYGINLIPYENTIAALEQMEAGNISAVVMEAPLAYALTRGIYQGKIKVVSRPLTDETIRLIARDETRGAHLIDSFDIGLDKVLKNGTYKNLIEKWELVTP